MMNGVSRGLLVVAALVPTMGQAQQQDTLAGAQLQLRRAFVRRGRFRARRRGRIDGDGLTLSGSFELTEDWHAYASYTNSDLDSSIDINTWALGAGYRYPLQDNVDIYGRVLYVNAKSTVPDRSPPTRTTTASGCKRGSACASAKCSRSRATLTSRRRRQRHGAAGERPLPLHAEPLGRHRPDVRRRYRQPRYQRALHVLTHIGAARAAMRARPPTP